jgi:formylglycine-generating enzyme required for sulfatase activity
MRRLVILAAMLAMVSAGCGGDDKPTSPSGTLHAMGHVGVSPDGSTEALVVVMDGGVVVRDATITLNGVPVPIDEYGEWFYWTDSLAVSPGDPVTLRVVTPQGSLTQETTVPAFLHISTPSNGAVFADDQEIPVAWNNVPDVSVVQLNYYEDDVDPFCFAELPVGSVSYVIPAAKTVLGTNTISVSAMRGAGSRPLDASRWNGESGFWVSARDEIDVTVGTSPPSGSCCALDGVCTVTLRAGCTGAWTVAGVCTPNPCVETGSCCVLDGTCAVTTQAACTGTWIPAGVCTPNPCPTQPPPTGMVWIPAGSVRLGQPNFETPVNDFYVESFYIDRYEVSNAKYKAFIDAGGYTTEGYWNSFGWAWRVENGITLPDGWESNTYHGGGVAGNEQFPVNGVSWYEADAYCRWAGKRLPTEAEWEKAAKGGCETHGDPGLCDAFDTPNYPWGEGIVGPQANTSGSGDPYDHDGDYGGSTTPVGYYDGSNHGGYQTIDSPSPYGLYDVTGNVQEWCSTLHDSYPYNPNDGRENPPESRYENSARVLRGGSWMNGAGVDLWCAFRQSYYHTGEPYDRSYRIGFRCARTGL